MAEEKKGSTALVTVAVKRALESVEGHRKANANMLVAPAALAMCPKQYQPAITTVEIPSTDPKDGWVYPIPGGDTVGLSKSVLLILGNASGLTWMHHQMGRVDNESYGPLYCRWKAVCRVTNFDGSKREVVAHKTIDLRDGSPLCLDLNRIAQKKEDKYAEKDHRDPRKVTADEQIAQMRANIESLAETKAMLRCVRAALGVKTSYTREEIKKPFVVCKMVWMPPQNDPVVDRMIAATELGIMENLFASGHGGQAGQALLGAGTDYVRQEIPEEADDDLVEVSIKPEPPKERPKDNPQQQQGKKDAGQQGGGGSKPKQKPATSDEPPPDDDVPPIGDPVERKPAPKTDAAKPKEQPPADSAKPKDQATTTAAPKQTTQPADSNAITCDCQCGCNQACTKDEIKASKAFGVIYCTRCNPDSKDYDAAAHQSHE